jgi:hypothetical protein
MYKEATKQEQADWQKNDRDWWAERALPIVGWLSAIQFVLIGGVLVTWYMMDVMVGL